MTRMLAVGLAVIASGAIVIEAQAPQAADVLRATRQALGGESRLSAIRTVSATGRTRMIAPNGQTEEAEFAISIELPDKFMKREVLMAMGPTSVYRNTGFNGPALINEIDAPPALASGGGPGNMIIRVEGGPGPGRGAAPTAEEREAANRRLLSDARQSFARLTLGMFASSFAGYPLTFTHAGTAEAPGGTADVIAVGDGAEFTARLFIDRRTHLPLMLSWMDREPLRIEVDDRGSGERMRVLRPGAEGGEEEPASGEQSMAERIRLAEANRRVVEFRAYYDEYTSVDGVQVPMRIARSIDGRAADEIVFERVRFNTRIDPKTFTPTAQAR